MAVAPAAETGQPGSQEARAPKKLLFIPAPMKGHAWPLMRLAEWFACRDGYETHVWLGDSWKSMAPEGAVVHSDFGMEKVEEWAQFFEQMFGGLTLTKDWYASLIGMLAAMGSESAGRVCGDMAVGAAKIVKKVSPQVVVADGMYQSDGALPGLCQRYCGAPFVAVQCPGRPEAWEKVSVQLAILLRHKKELEAVGQQIGPVLSSIQMRTLEETGPALPKPHKWPVLMPGLRAISGIKAKPNQRYCGPFLRVPEPRDDSRRRQRRRASMAEFAGSELIDWLLDESLSDPIVYVALGTLVQINDDIARRLVEGLEGGPWRVLWSLPEAQQEKLPARARSNSPKWRVESNVPQVTVLGYEGVQCFVSHCGQNSMHEGLAVGVPMVCMPFYCDQYEWAESVCKFRKAGVMLDKLTSGPEEIKAAVELVLTVKSFKENALACAEDFLKASNACQRPPDGKQGGTAYAGVPNAARIIEETLQRGPPSEPPKKCCVLQ